MRNSLTVALLLGLICEGIPLAGAASYENNFEKTPIGTVPEDFLVVDGGFAVREMNGNKLLELPGSPLESFGLLFGPTFQSGQFVSARILGTNKGRRVPTFGVGLNGMPGFKLQVSPGKKKIELLRGDAIVVSSDFEWESGKWLLLRLQLSRGTDGSHQVQGKAWLEGGGEPKEWLIQLPVSELPPAGRAMIIGSPYAGTPILYDDLKTGLADK